MKSWRTTLGGLLASAGQFIPWHALPEAWHWVGPALTGLGTLLLGLAARDNVVTSEEAGAK